MFGPMPHVLALENKDMALAHVAAGRHQAWLDPTNGACGACECACVCVRAHAHVRVRGGEIERSARPLLC